MNNSKIKILIYCHKLSVLLKDDMIIYIVSNVKKSIKINYLYKQNYKLGK